MNNTEPPAHPDSAAGVRIPMEVRWGDMDALRHVNNVAYYRYFEEARVQCLERVRRRFSPKERAYVLAHASCDFLQPLFYPASIVVVLTLTRLGRSSLDLGVRIEREDAPGVVVAQGRNVLVGVHDATGAALPWTDQERDAIVQCFHAENSV